MSENASDPPLRPSLSTLPHDLVLQIVARVPKRRYPVLSCASKQFLELVCSREIHIARRKLDKDCLYIGFAGAPTTSPNGWFALRRNETEPAGDLLISTDFPFSPINTRLYPVPVGPLIFFMLPTGSFILIYDTRSGVLREGPSMIGRARRVHFHIDGLGLVRNQIYVFGSRRKNIGRGAFATEYFVDTLDVNNMERGWLPADLARPPYGHMFPMAHETKVIDDGKVCGLCPPDRGGFCKTYDTKDGSQDSRMVMPGKWNRTSGSCVIDNVLFAYEYELGFLWYDSAVRQWKVVSGLSVHQNLRNSAMGEYYGKLAFVWTEKSPDDTDQCFCTMIDLERSESGFSGTAARIQHLGSVSGRSSALWYCVSLSA